MARHPHRSEQRRPAWKPLIITIGILLVLVSGLLSLSLFTHSVKETASVRSQPSPAPTSIHRTGRSAVASPTLSAVATRAATPAQSVLPPGARLVPVLVRAYTIEGPMADGKTTHLGACAVSPDQFPLGSILSLYNPADKTFNRQCTAEDTGPDIQQGQIDLAMPNDVDGATKWGQRTLLVYMVRRGWSSPTPVTTKVSVHAR